MLGWAMNRSVGETRSLEMRTSERIHLRDCSGTYLQTLSKICDPQTGRPLKLRKVYQQLMGNPAIDILIPEVIMTIEAVSPVIGVQKFHLGRINTAFAAQNLDVRPCGKSD